MAAAATVNVQIFEPQLAPLETLSSQSVSQVREIQRTLEAGSVTHPLVLSVTDLDQAQTSARPAHVLFGALNDPEFRLKKPIRLDLSREETGVMLSWGEIDEFATGETIGEAIDDFAHVVRELRRVLYDPGAKLGPDLKRVKQVFEEYIVPRSR